MIRSFISIPAGIFGSPLGRYTVLTLIGSAVWCFAFAAAGYVAGDNWEEFHHGFRYADYVVAAVVLAGVALRGLEDPAASVEKRAANPGYTGSSEDSP